MINSVFYKHPEKNPEDSDVENEGATECPHLPIQQSGNSLSMRGPQNVSPSSYPTTRKFLVQKGMSTMVEFFSVR
jgi:hypothetical protein